MSNWQNNQSPQLQFEVEQFYYHEADLLDERKFQTWLSLLAPDMEYLVPGRFSPERDKSLKGTESYLAVDAEMQSDDVSALPIREESMMLMAFRVQRVLKQNAWGSNPPARTRRMVSNVMIECGDENLLQIKSNFHMFYSRHRDDNFQYQGQRIDVLQKTDTGFLVKRREVRFDWNVIEAPTLGLFF